MAENTAIEWCDDSVSFWWGCTHHGPGCLNCYAERIARRFGDTWGPKSPRLYIESAVATLHKLNRKAEREGRPRTVFINSMSDFFEDHEGPLINRKKERSIYVGTADDDLRYQARKPITQRGERWATIADLRRDAFEVFDECQWLRFLLLTKRPENIRCMFSPAAWARPCDLDWLRSVRDQCQAAGVPVFVKQLGSQPFHVEFTGSGPGNTGWPEEHWMRPGRHDEDYVLSATQIADSKGGNINEWPADLRVREFFHAR